MDELELWVRFMCNYDVWVNKNYEWGHTDRHTHINTMTWPGVGAGPSENNLIETRDTII